MAGKAMNVTELYSLGTSFERRLTARPPSDSDDCYSTMSIVALCPWRAAALERSARKARMVWPLRPMMRPTSVWRICNRKTVRRPFGISERITSSGNSSSWRMMNSRNWRTRPSLTSSRRVVQSAANSIPQRGFPKVGFRRRVRPRRELLPVQWTRISPPLFLQTRVFHRVLRRQGLLQPALYSSSTSSGRCRKLVRPAKSNARRDRV
jgi:hypothetical protein